MPDASRMRTLGRLFMLCQSVTRATAVLSALWITLRSHTFTLRALPATATLLGFYGVRHGLLPAAQSAHPAI
ncbi:hypothetical protein M2371_002835 [Buttiauxella sp. BIGb0471]|nr:hypothetical protein [Buttiauxella sp. BIGb0471]